MKRTLLIALVAAAPLSVHAQAVLFSDNFDSNSTANWTFNSSTAGDTATDNVNNEANYFFDYSTIGIASANGPGGSTRGMKLEANVFNSVTGTQRGLSVSPLSQSFSGDYKLQFHMWQNFQGPMPGGGNGTTVMSMGGIGANGTSAQVPMTTVGGLGFGATYDGGSATDYRGYNASVGGAQLPSTIFAAAGTGNQNSSHAYYSGFQGSVPAAQTSIAAGLGLTTHTGTTNVGVTGMAWRYWEIKKVGNTVTWHIDGLLMATVVDPNLTNGNNIFLGAFDTNTAPSTQAFSRDLLFTLVDNVKVTAVPEPGTMAALGLGAAALLRRRRAKK